MSFNIYNSHQALSHGATGTLPGITAQTMAGLTASNISILSNDIFSISPNVKKYEIYEFNEDVLALSVTWKRMRDNKNSIASRLTDSSLFMHVNSEDRALANVIADYYSKKIMMLKLTDNSKLTSYRTDLNDFVHGDRKKIVDKMFGLAYHLPAFYEYDIELDSIRSDLVTKHDWANTSHKQNGKQQSLVLTPLKRLRRKTKNLDAYQYWLRSTNGTGVVISLQTNNTLLNLWEHFFNKKEPLVLSGTTFCKSLDGFEYLSIKNWQIVHS